MIQREACRVEGVTEEELIESVITILYRDLFYKCYVVQLSNNGTSFEATKRNFLLGIAVFVIKSTISVIHALACCIDL